jgi:hypothetical protein
MVPLRMPSKQRGSFSEVPTDSAWLYPGTDHPLDAVIGSDHLACAVRRVHFRPCRAIEDTTVTASMMAISKADGATLVVFLHVLLEFVQASADHLVLVVEVSERLACGPVEHPLIDFSVLPFWDIDKFSGAVRMTYHVFWAKELFWEGFDIYRAVGAARHLRWPEGQLDGEHVIARVAIQPPGPPVRRAACEMMRHTSRVIRFGGCSDSQPGRHRPELQAGLPCRLLASSNVVAHCHLPGGQLSFPLSFRQVPDSCRGSPSASVADPGL